MGPRPALATPDKPMLCRQPNPHAKLVRHCTTLWHLDPHGQIVSDDPAWGPADSSAFLLDAHFPWPHARGAALSLRARLAVHPTPVVSTPAAKPTVSTPHSGGWSSPSSSGPYGLWVPPPGHPAYALPDFSGDPNASYYGFCTWYAQYRRQDERLINLGNAAQWPFAAPAHGLHVGSAPVVGATVVFQPGVFGAGAGGHAAHVEAVYAGGWLLISEMNMAWNGGGWGRVSFRYAVVGPGVSFIY
jgi:surface antigen